MCALLITGV